MEQAGESIEGCTPKEIIFIRLQVARNEMHRRTGIPINKYLQRIPRDGFNPKEIMGQINSVKLGSWDAMDNIA